MKVATALCMIVCVLVMASYPWTVGKPPARSESVPVRRDYAIRSATYFGTICLTLIGAAVGSWLILRRARHDYREASRNNLERLVVPEDDDGRV
ncbi:MAG: hypothetical protein SFX74_02295 [Fimbriimonadaceae bacterium]|nr:hypothetical protein [Fimbriimonadaceae bacterium]